MDNGILAAEWSPDGELMAIITGGAVLILFTKVCPTLMFSSWFACAATTVIPKAMPLFGVLLKNTLSTNPIAFPLSCIHQGYVMKRLGGELAPL